MHNIFIHDYNENDHLKHFRMVFQKIREAGLKLNF